MDNRRNFMWLVLAVLALLAASRAEAVLTYTVEAGGWPNAAHRDAAVAAIQASVDRYNAYSPSGFGNYNVYVYYNAGIPTAQASFAGSIGFGGTYPNQRVMLHELAHYVGLPYGNKAAWDNFLAGGSWSGPQASALVKQFEGDQATLNGDGIHFWPYGLNFDSEYSEIAAQRNVAMVYGMRADMGIGPTAHPSTATTVTLTSSDPFGQSGFNYQSRWSDGYFPHAGADYFTGNFVMRTPESPHSFTFAGDSLTLANPTVDTGLYFKGVGNSGIITFNDLILDGGWIDHRSSNGLNDLFQLDGNLTVASNSHMRALNGNIHTLADVHGNGSLTIHPTLAMTDDNRYVRFLSSQNTFAGDIVNNARFELAAGANFTFDIGPSGASNSISGASARRTLLNGTFELDLASATTNPGDSWALVTAANASYGGSFAVAGFDPVGNAWSDGTYKFTPATGLLTLVTQWATSGGGNWSTAANWTDGVPLAAGDATLGSALTPAGAPATIHLDVPVSLGRLTFDNTSKYQLGTADRQLVLTGAAAVNVKQGEHEIAAQIVGANGLAKRGPGTLILSAANPYGGATVIEQGTLKLTGSGAMVNTNHIDVRPGATFDASSLSAPFELRSGQSLTNNSDTTVVGEVHAASGATIAGSGTFAGNVVAQAGSVVRVGGQGLAFAAGHAKIDDFQAYTPGKLNAGATGGTWTGVFDGTANAQVVADDGNRSLEYYGTGNSWRGASTSLRDAFDADYALADGDSGTYFFRVQRQGSQTIDGIFGLTDLPTIGIDAPWQELAITLSLFQGTDPRDTTALRAYDTGGGDIVVRSGIAADEWVNVWLVVDNNAKTYRIATSTGSQSGVLHPTTFDFGRRTAAGAPLTTFAGAEFRSGSNPAGAAVRIDDLFYLEGTDLANPLNPVGETLTIHGDLRLAPGSWLALDLFSGDITDRVQIGGTLEMAGALEVVLDAGAPTLAAGNTFDLFDFATASGAFDLFHLPPLASGLRWDTSNLAVDGSLAVVAGLDGDFNGDGRVDLADYTVWRDHLGHLEDAAVLAGNGTGDTLVDNADYVLWKTNFGSQLSASLAAGTATVPEPAAALLVALAAACLLSTTANRQRP